MSQTIYDELKEISSITEKVRELIEKIENVLAPYHFFETATALTMVISFLHVGAVIREKSSYGDRIKLMELSADGVKENMINMLKEVLTNIEIRKNFNEKSQSH